MKKNKFLLLLPVIFLTSCGYSTNYLVQGDRYNSSIFQNNYYRHWDSELKNAKDGLNIELQENDYITKFADLYKIDPLTYDKYEDANAYGADYKMNGVNEMFNYGYQSKLFDGQMVCGGQNGHPEFAYQLGRVQTDKDGFSIRFNKESNDLKYFASQFKASTDNTAKVYRVNSDELAKSDGEQFHNSTVQLTLSFYTKDDKNDIIKNSFTGEINFDNDSTNNGSRYIFYAFDLSAYNLSRLVGVSVNYTFQDELVEWNKQKGVDVDYSLMIYEFFLPYTSWN